MKKSILLFGAFLVLFLNGCNKDDSHTSVLGSWNCEEYSDLGQRIYQVSISRNQYLPNADNEYIISNFHNLGITESTYVYVREEGVEGNKVLIITGTDAAANGITFSGQGKIAPDFSRIEWDYQVTDGVQNPTVRANYY